MKRYGCVLALMAALAGCQTAHDQMVQQGYPPAFADGYHDGCSSGRAAAASFSGNYSKDVNRYMGDKLYSGGWDDGFRQCQAQAVSRDQQEVHDRVLNDRDRDWETQKTRMTYRAYHGD
ncbi:hypothetical protein [Pseudomonas sp. NPDC007930]|uniref:hypothetical protein n=1 Tax=Pseudomonas sp. NPDC007930 TaxID=3364417 RepID=UPI0036F0BDF4